MQDIFDKFATHEAPLAYYRVDRMVLSPRHWRDCKLQEPLSWTPIPFTKKNASQVPMNKRGVYTFVVKPGIANLGHVSYLIYVGKVEKQTFRKRYRQYLKHFQKGAKSNWFHVSTFLHKWQNYLWFCWAPLTAATTISTTEKRLIAAYIPPANRRFYGKVGKEVKLLFA